MNISSKNEWITPWAPAVRTGSETVAADAAMLAARAPQPAALAASGRGEANTLRPSCRRRISVSRSSVLNAGSRAVNPRRPHTVSCGMAIGSSVRGAMKASALLNTADAAGSSNASAALAKVGAIHSITRRKPARITGGAISQPAWMRPPQTRRPGRKSARQ